MTDFDPGLDGVAVASAWLEGGSARRLRVRLKLVGPNRTRRLVGATSAGEVCSAIRAWVLSLSEAQGK